MTGDWGSHGTEKGTEKSGTEKGTAKWMGSGRSGTDTDWHEGTLQVAYCLIRACECSYVHTLSFCFGLCLSRDRRLWS